MVQESETTGERTGEGSTLVRAFQNAKAQILITIMHTMFQKSMRDSGSNSRPLQSCGPTARLSQLQFELRIDTSIPPHTIISHYVCTCVKICQFFYFVRKWFVPKLHCKNESCSNYDNLDESNDCVCNILTSILKNNEFCYKHTIVTVFIGICRVST